MIGQALLVFAAVASFAFCLCTLAAVWYQRSGYHRYFRARYSAAWTPECALIVPCKGSSPELAQSLSALLQLDYPRYRVFFAVESAADPACAVIEELVAADPRCTLVVAGLATRCAQMNHNLLAGVAAAGTPAVYAFADARLQPRPDWLRELLLPLSSPEVTASTGFRWPLAKTGGAAGGLAHVHCYLFLYSVFASACLASSVGLWGGAMALRREQFEELEVAALWARTSTPDMSLSRAIVERRLKAVLVPGCVTPSDDLIESPAAAVRWFERQCMYLKAHYPLIWSLVVFPAALLFALQLWLPFALLLSATGQGSLEANGGLAALVLLAGELTNAALFSLLGELRRLPRFLCWMPLLRCAPILGLLRTLFSRSIWWAGARYRLGPRGTVASVDR